MIPNPDLKQIGQTEFKENNTYYKKNKQIKPRCWNTPRIELKKTIGPTYGIPSK